MAPNAEAVLRTLSPHERKLLAGLRDAAGEVSFGDAARAAGLGETEAANAASWLASKGLLETRTETHQVAVVGKEGQEHVQDGLPEWRALKHAQRHGERTTIGSLLREKQLAQSEVAIALGWLKRLGLAELSKESGDTVIQLTEKGRRAADEGLPHQRLLEEIRDAGEFAVDRDPEGVKLLAGRQNVVVVKEETSRFLRLTEEGRHLAASRVEVQEEIAELTPQVIRSREWESKPIRPYDVAAFAPAAVGGKPHPMAQFMEEIRQIFIGLGFREIEGHYVEPAFWNMDALFIPQDHPAREMQDTFYLDEPRELPVDARLVPRIAKVHESGGDTGSRGWGGKWDRSEAKRGLLRTHTTVNTIRHLAAHPDVASKVFSIGRVFRKETMDATHLPEFHQIEGIVHEPGANFRRLIGILKEFYARMGFPQIRYRPAYFPYTEPSMEIEVLWHGRWMELGGAGIFRPEVTQPLGVKYPVLAWGLGLERLAMQRFALQDIRDLYVSDVDWLRKAPIGRPKQVLKP